MVKKQKIILFIFSIFSFVNCSKKYNIEKIAGFEFNANTTIQSILATNNYPINGPGQWTVKQAQEWYALQPFIIGCNYTPAYADNEIEFWQTSTFNINAINNELNLCNKIGINTVRVFLHFLLWQEDSVGFKQRINSFLSVASKNNIRTIFVLFDDCWKTTVALGPQPEPIPCIHNSQWVQSPGNNLQDSFSNFQILLRYACDIIYSFKNDPRILAWDLYNELGCSAPIAVGDSGDLRLMEATYILGRSIRPSQPLMVCYLSNVPAGDPFNWETQACDVFSFHYYADYLNTFNIVNQCKSLSGGRPIICTEYMARTLHSTFQWITPFFKENHIGAINWGCVAGRTQTYIPWSEGCGLPWFHDIFNADGTSHVPEETNILYALSNSPYYDASNEIDIIPTADKDINALWYYTTNTPNATFLNNYYNSISNYTFNQTTFTQATQNMIIGKAGFGNMNNPNLPYLPDIYIRTNWATNNTDIYLLRNAIIPNNIPIEAIQNMYLRLFHNDAATVYINGYKIIDENSYPTYNNNYILYKLPYTIISNLKPGSNITMAIHCKNISGNPYIDAGLIGYINN